jgi:endonuclease YncB( thermonuclease family)
VNPEEGVLRGVAAVVAAATVARPVLALLTGCASEPAARGRVEHGRVATVADGDTLRLTDGRRIRLVQIDAPERGRECFGERARLALVQLAPPGGEVTLARVPALDDHDRFGRLLRTARVGGRNLNLALVAEGAAAPYFYRGARGRFASLLQSLALRARARHLGLWGACPSTGVDFYRAVNTGTSK